MIKDTPFDISKLKSKRRYEINKGNKNFRVQKIIPSEMTEEIYLVAEKAFSAYPEKYRPTLDKDGFIDEINLSWAKFTVFGAFNDRNSLCGYAYLYDHDDYSEFEVLKVDPAEEKNGINAALVDGVLREYETRLKDGNFYICDGARAIRHQTHFQDYLEKYFDFRKAYCYLHIKYRWYVRIIIKILKPFYPILSKSDNKLVWNIASLIEMDRICEES